MCAEDYEYAMESGCLSLKCNVRDKSDEEEEDAPILPYLGMTEVDDKVALINSSLAEYVGTLFLVVVAWGEMKERPAFRWMTSQGLSVFLCVLV